MSIRLPKLLHAVLRPVVFNPHLNVLLRPLWRIPRPWLPSRLANTFPVVGRYRVTIPGGGTLVLESPGRDTIAQLLYWDGLDQYEPSTVELFRRLARRSRVILDVGANIGMFSLIAAFDNPRARIYAFEPVPHIFNRLSRHITLNKLNNITASELALSDRLGTAMLYIPRRSVSRALDASLMAGFRSKCLEVEVRIMQLDAFVDEHGITGVDLIKVDVESAETLVLQGASRTIAKERPVMICEVLYGSGTDGLYDVLKRMELRYLWIRDHDLIEQTRPIGDSEWKNNNYLLVPQERWHEVASQLGAPFALRLLSVGSGAG